MSSAQLHEQMKKGSINSSDFLPKFAATLTEHFSKGLKNAGESLISQMNVLGNTFLKLQLDMGKSLTPFFTHVINTLIEGMQMVKSIWDSLNENSSFIDTLKFLFDWAVKLIPIWAGYRLVMMSWNGVMMLSSTLETLFTREIMANTAATAINGATMSATGVQVAGFGAFLSTATVETEAATGAFVALEGALASFGIGAAVIGFGLLVEKLIELNKESKEAADNLTRITKVEGIGKSNTDMFTDLYNRYKDYGHAGSGADKSVLLTDLMQAQKYQQDNLTKDVHPALQVARDAASAANKILGYQEQQVSTGSGGIPIMMKMPIYGESDPVKRNQLNKDLAAEEKINANMIKNLTGITMLIQNLQSDQGIKPGKLGSGGTSEGLTTSAFNTSSLAGASGGLGQAKQIIMNFNGPIQQNNGVRESKGQSDEAVQKIIEMLDGFSSSQNSQ
jgi:hypothetical protein